MDCNQGSGFADENVVQIQSRNLENDVCRNHCLGSIDRAVSATEDGIQNIETSFDTNSKPIHEGSVFQFEEGSESQNKRPQNSLMPDLMASNQPKAFGKMFYKTKLCFKFRAGTCTLANNCNYAHSIEELSEPPPNWQEILAAPNEENPESSETKEVFQIPVVEFSRETHGTYMRQYCWRYSTEGGCAYGENCNFIHEEFPEYRESVAICLLPGDGYDSTSKPTVKFPNWKTRLCTVWEIAGRCTFGSQCNFAHGSAELRRYDGGLANRGVKDSSVSNASAGAAGGTHSYGTRAPSRKRLANVIHQTRDVPARRWNGPDKISKIYGDWIDDL